MESHSWPYIPVAFLGSGSPASLPPLLQGLLNTLGLSLLPGLEPPASQRLPADCLVLPSDSLGRRDGLGTRERVAEFPEPNQDQHFGRDGGRLVAVVVVT